MKKKKLKAFVIESGKTLNSGEQFVQRLSKRLKEVKTVDQCDVVLAICPIVSRVGTDVEAAMNFFREKCHCSTEKPMILVVLHHTFDTNYVVPDCSRYAGDRVCLIVNGLFHEDHGFLKNCDVNTEATTKTLGKLKQFQKKGTLFGKLHMTGKKLDGKHPLRVAHGNKTVKNLEEALMEGPKLISDLQWKPTLKAFVIESGNTLNSGQQFVKDLSYRSEEVKMVDECDVILAVCPIVSRVGTDVEAAMNIFEEKCHCSSTPKPMILVVLHHTFDRDYVIPDCSRYAGDRVSLIVNALYHEDHGLLKNCDVNTEAIAKTLERLKAFQKQKMKKDKGK